MTIVVDEEIIGSTPDTVCLLSGNVIFMKDGEVLLQEGGGAWFFEGDRVLQVAADLPDSWKAQPERRRYVEGYGSAFVPAQTWFIEDAEQGDPLAYRQESAQPRRNLWFDAYEKGIVLAPHELIDRRLAFVGTLSTLQDEIRNFYKEKQVFPAEPLMATLLRAEGAKCPKGVPQLDGVVNVQVTIEPDGKVSKALVTKTDLPASYQNSAVQTALRTDWEPARNKDGLAVRSEVTLPISFSCSTQPR